MSPPPDDADGSPDPDSPVSLPTDPDPEPSEGDSEGDLVSDFGSGLGSGLGGDPASQLRRRRLPIRSPRIGDESGFGGRISVQLSQLRNERQARMSMPVPQRSGYAAPEGPRRAEVPYGVELTAAWSWRLILIVIATGMFLYALSYLGELVIPLVVAMLITALTVPVVELLVRVGVRRSLASLLVVLTLILVVVSLLTLAGQQIASGAQDLSDQTVKGIDQVRDYLTTGPFHVRNSTIDNYIDTARDKATDYAKGEGIGQVTEVGATLTRLFAGVFITLLSMYFFLADGSRIWAWIVRLSPRTARERVDSSGRVAWISLTQFVRATVIVAVTDAVLIAIAAAILQVPFVLAIGVLVFLGGFIPIVGATVAGSVAVLVALVDRGPVVALIMLASVVLVQQIEAHGLQPFLMGRWVSVHPLGVIVAITTGIILAGVAGALVAVPLAAALNAVGQHLAAGTSPGGDPERELRQDYREGLGGPHPEPAP